MESTELQAAGREALKAAGAAGENDGANQAEWWEQDVLGGRASGDVTGTARRILAGLEDGDPEVYDGLPTPDVAGAEERGEGITDLVETALRDAGFDPEVVEEIDAKAYGELLQEAASRYEQAFQDTVTDRVAAACQRALPDAPEEEEGPDYPDDDDPEPEPGPYPGSPQEVTVDWARPDGLDIGDGDPGDQPVEDCCAVHDAGGCWDGCPYAYPCGDEEAEEAAYSRRNPTTMFAVETRYRAVIDWGNRQVSIYRPDGGGLVVTYGLPRVGPDTEAQTAAELAAQAAADAADGPEAPEEGSTPTPPPAGPHTPAQAPLEAVGDDPDPFTSVRPWLDAYTLLQALAGGDVPAAQQAYAALGDALTAAEEAARPTWLVHLAITFPAARSAEEAQFEGERLLDALDPYLQSRAPAGAPEPEVVDWRIEEE